MTRRKMQYRFLLSGALIALIALVAGCDGPASGASTTAAASYPAQVALKAMGEGFQESATNLRITQRVDGGEMPEKAEVTVEETGLMDDSVEAERTVFSLQFKDGQWTIAERVKTQRCRTGRGHQDFSSQPCQ